MKCLLVDERLLQRMRVVGVAKTFERGDATPRHLRYPRYTGTRGFTVDQHRAGAALSKPATEFRAIKLYVIAQDLKQGCFRLGRDIDALTI